MNRVKIWSNTNISGLKMALLGINEQKNKKIESTTKVQYPVHLYARETGL